MENSDVFSGLQDFLQRMRQPSAADFVKSIKSFIVSLSNNARDPEKDSAAVQEFFANMEAAFRAHPLWSGCSEEEVESAGEGLEKYVMTKLFTRLFASLPDDVKVDDQLSEKMALIQQFIRPENLDIKTTFQNEGSWLLAQKELQKINMYKAPRDKLQCILNCCRVINNLLLNASIASNESPPGADEFLPVLIYVTIKANPPQLHSNLLYIQRYRRQSRLVSEAAYYFTNMLSAESFILNIDANALSMDETEFEKNMESARTLLFGLSAEFDASSNQSEQNAETKSNPEPDEPKIQASNPSRNPVTNPKSPVAKVGRIPDVEDHSIPKTPSLSELENKGATTLLKEEHLDQVFQDYPYLFARVGDLTINDVEDLLNNYKQLVLKYVALSKGLGIPTSAIPQSSSHSEVASHAKTVEKPEGSREDLREDTRTADNMESTGTLTKEETESSLPQDDERNRVVLDEKSSPEDDEKNGVALEEDYTAALSEENSESKSRHDEGTNRVARVEEENLPENHGENDAHSEEGKSESKLQGDMATPKDAEKDGSSEQ